MRNYRIWRKKVKKMSTLRKAEYIAKHGEDAYKKHLAQSRAYQKAHKEKEKARRKKYREEHPEEESARNQERGRKGGKHYDKHLAYEHTGLQGDRNRIRMKHAKQYRPYKDIIAPESQIHHEWIEKTAEYTGVALVEKEPHHPNIGRQDNTIHRRGSKKR